VLLYQFHDIIPGSSIKRVYDESRERYAVILDEIASERAGVLAFLCGSGTTESPDKPTDSNSQKPDSNSQKTGVAGTPLGAFNPTSFARTEYQRLEDGWYRAELAPYGFAAFEKTTVDTPQGSSGDTIENNSIKLRFSPDGHIISAISKQDGFEYSGGQLNALRLYRDKWLYYNAWDIDWQYHKKPSRLLKAYKHETHVDGPVVTRRSYYKHRRTTITQEVTLHVGLPIIYFKTTCDYHETFKMLRADFDVRVKSPTVKCDIQMGSIDRSTGDETPEEKAQFEICAHKYVDLSDEAHGVSLMSDCKYGHRVKGSRLSLNLLRSPVYPDRTADRLRHSFTYALFLHPGGCGTETLAHSYALNKPIYQTDGIIEAAPLAQTDNPAVVVETIKRAHTGDGVIIRLFESQGHPATCSLNTIFDTGHAYETDLLENIMQKTELKKLEFGPFEIKTFKIMD
jgi:alpha-mannosidase